MDACVEFVPGSQIEGCAHLKMVASMRESAFGCQDNRL